MAKMMLKYSDHHNRAKETWTRGLAAEG